MFPLSQINRYNLSHDTNMVSTRFPALLGLPHRTSRHQAAGRIRQLIEPTVHTTFSRCGSALPGEVQR